MVSNASEDFPEPLTPVTTVMALCGTSTVTFLRLWTRAPWTRNTSCSGFEISTEAVICLVAKGNPRQQVSKLLPKLQIIRWLSKAGKWWFLPGFAHGSVGAGLRLLCENDFSNAPAHFQVNRSRRFSESFVSIGTTFLFQPVSANRPDSP